MKKTFISYIPFKDLLFGKKQYDNEYENKIDIPTSNAKNSIENICIDCLRKNGYDESCINNFTLECRNAAVNYCSQCESECQNLCSEDAGGGNEVLPYWYSSNEPSVLSYNEYDANLKSYPISQNLEAQGPYGPVNDGINIISSVTTEELNGKDPCGTFKPAPFSQECVTCLQQNKLLSTTDCGCSDYYTENCENELIKNKELINSVCCEACKENEVSEKLLYTDEYLISSDCEQQNSQDQNFNSVITFRSGNGSGGGGNGGMQTQTGGIGHNTSSGNNRTDDDTTPPPPPPTDCPDACKQVLMYPRGAPGTDPFYVLYKHTGCHLVWYPPEFGFDNNPFITQCKGFISDTGDPVSCHPEYAYFDHLVGADAGSYDYGACAAYDRFAWGIWPCYCTRFPHIRGGIYDTLYKLPNINTRAGQFGYISYLDPFTPPMKYSEAGCCYCGSTRESVAARNGQVTWPQWFGQYWNQAPQGFAGSNCTPGSNLVTPFVNTGYKESCYEYGISPYLRRVAETDYKPGYDIWTYGGGSQTKQDLGPFYSVRNFNQRPYWFDFIMDWDEVTAQKTKLQNSLIGFVGLEHHFEFWAYKSNDLAAPKLGPVQNHCNILNGPFERGYGGSLSNLTGCANFTMDNRGSLMWQLYRKTPRRFMYGGSKVPLFHFDLYNFEMMSKQKKILINGQIFDPKTFLKAYYNYFYTVAISKGIDPNTQQPRIFEFEPIHLFDDLNNDYEYVRASLTEMIRFNVISIKDHVPDIVEETNNIIASAKYVQDPETQQQVLKLTPYVDGLVGGVAGYMDLVNFFGVQPITGKITADQVRRFLIDSGSRENLEIYNPKIEGPGTQSYFRFPRRAFLPPYIKGGELVGWGCKNPLDPNDISVCSGYGSPAANVTDYSNIGWSKGRYTKVFSGMYTNYWLTSTGQIVGNGFNGNGLGNIPASISVPGSESDLTDRTSFGTVKKVSSKSLNFAIALAHFDYGVNYGDPSTGQYSCGGKNGGDNPVASRPVYDNSNLNKILAWGSKACEYGVLDKNNDQKWQDASSGFSHIVGIVSNFTAGSTYHGVSTLVQTAGDNSYGQSFSPTLPSGVYEYSNSIAKPGYFTEQEWTDLINRNLNLVCQNSGANADQNDVRCGLFFNEISGLSDARPIWNLAGAGHFHTILTQSDNQVRVWGKYFRILKDGTKDPLCPEIDVFVPDEVKGIASQWSLTRGTNNFGDEIVKSAVVTPSTEEIKFIDGGPDYTMMATKNKIYVWGRKEMLPGAITLVDEESDPDHLLMGATGYYTFTVNGEIQNIAAGPNCWIVNYKVETENTSVDASLNSFPEYAYIKHVRKDTYDINNTDKWNFGFNDISEEDKSSFGYKWMSAGYANISAISFGNVEFPKWDYNLFDLEETRLNQFSLSNQVNGKPLPKYFKSFAFFRALPGGWDFSKWIYGKNCNQGLDTVRAPGGVTKCQTPDLCSVLGEPDPNDYTGLKNDNWSYSGHPQYWWMNKAARRYQSGVGLYQSRDSACNDPELSTKPIGGCPGGVQQQVEASQALLTGCQIDYDLCWQIDGQPVSKTVGEYYGNADGSRECVHKCNDGDILTGNYVINSVPTTKIARTCTNELGRVGFRSGKDYFLQSYKVFGLKNYCCRTIHTYLSYATYALRNTAFARDESTGNWTIQTNPDPYRTGFASNSIKSMAPGSAGLAKYLEYPYIYLGGKGLSRLENSYYTAVFGSDAYPRLEDGGCNDLNLCPYDPGSAGKKILGPGGWILSMLSLAQWNDGDAGRPLNTDGYYKQGIFSYNKIAQLTTPFNLLSGGYGTISGSTYSWCVPNAWSDGNSGWVPLGNDNYSRLPLSSGSTYCYTKNLVVFDIDDERNYANTYDLSLIKWNKVYYDPILKQADGVTGTLGCFGGLNGAINSVCGEGYNVRIVPYIASNTGNRDVDNNNGKNNRNFVVQVADIFCDFDLCPPSE